MGIHVTRSARGTAAVLSVRRAGERTRPSVRRPGASSSGGKKGAASGGSSGTTGDFGADFE